MGILSPPYLSLFLSLQVACEERMNAILDRRSFCDNCSELIASEIASIDRIDHTRNRIAC